MANRQISGSSAKAGPAPARPAKKHAPGRLTGGLVAMSSVAIVSVYAAGYLNTQAADGQIASQTDSLATASATNVGSAVVAPSMVQQTGSSGSASANNSSAAPAVKPAATPAKASGAQAASYKDGTYTGMGSSRHGSIQATVVVSGGSIVSANVTGCGTRYPCSKVTSLVSQVVSRQSAPVNYVSGATDSSTAYIQAVKSALAQAAPA